MFDTIDIFVILDIFVLIFIGMGPLKVMVPFTKVITGLSPDLQRQVARKMVFTATRTAIILLLVGALLMQALHISTGALAVAGGLILLLLSLGQVMGSKSDDGEVGERPDPLLQAIYPLGVPLLLNPIGIVVLVVLSGEATTIPMYALVIGLVLVMTVINLLFFTNVQRITNRIDPAQSLVTEKVFGIFLAALAVQIILTGLEMVGIITLSLY